MQTDHVFLVGTGAFAAWIPFLKPLTGMFRKSNSCSTEECAADARV